MTVRICANRGSIDCYPVLRIIWFGRKVVMKEVYKTIELNGLNYYISNYGNIKSDHRKIKTRKDKDGYLVFTAGKKNNRNTFKVHRLVAILFIVNPDNLPEVNHKDFNRENPIVSNLEWCTHDYNINYTNQNNMSIIRDLKGENNPNSKLNSEDVKLIKHLLENNTVASIAKKFNVGWQTINHIKQGNTWK
mgnify:CR=1 FL=1|jgi:hypothetical protein